MQNALFLWLQIFDEKLAMIGENLVEWKYSEFGQILRKSFKLKVIKLNFIQLILHHILDNQSLIRNFEINNFQAPYEFIFKAWFKQIPYFLGFNIDWNYHQSQLSAMHIFGLFMKVLWKLL